MLTFARKPQTTTAAEPASESPQRARAHATRPPVWTRAARGPLLAPLRVSEPGGALEREADRAAEIVLRTPDHTLQRGCPGCPSGDKNGLIQRQAAREATTAAAPAHVIPGGGHPLPTAERRFFEPRFGTDFRDVRVHTGPQAERSAEALRARAYTLGRDIVFGRGQYAPGTPSGRRLLAHELTHVLQQRGAGAEGIIQRAVSYDVITWDANRLGPPVPVNGADPRLISIPPTGQIEITADVAVDGDPADPCTTQDIGTTQTAWSAWTIADYRGQTNADGSITVRHNAVMPMRDPTPAGGVWYDPANISSVASCGDVTTIRHFDSPWHSVPKARNNGAVAGSPLNYLVRYRRGLLLVTYLTTQDAAGNFRRQPLRFRYWNTIQDFTFTPQYPAPPGNAAFLGMWPFMGGITVNIGSSGSGETSDAPYYTTAGDTYNDHFNTFANWTVTERAP